MHTVFENRHTPGGLLKQIVRFSVLEFPWSHRLVKLGRLNKLLTLVISNTDIPKYRLRPKNLVPAYFPVFLYILTPVSETTDISR